MNLPRNLGHTLLAVYLILVGLTGIAHISLGLLWWIVPLLALLAGICMFTGK